MVEFLECSVKVVCVDGRVEAEGEAHGDCLVGAGESSLSSHGVGRVELEGLLGDGS
jgi:LDH2 family malate/lactate/ureidoglycolate dehydrogenase